MKLRMTLAAVVVFVGLAPACLGKEIVAQGGNLRGAAVAVATDTGDFVVAWEDLSGTDGKGDPIFGVFARLYDRSGVPKGPAFRVHDKRGGDQSLPKVASDPAGNFVVVWRGGTPAVGTTEWPGGDGDGHGVFFQRFDSGGQRLGPLTRASSTVKGSQAQPNVALHADGSFEIVWQDCSQSVTCAYLRVARFSATGERQGAELVIPIVNFVNPIFVEPDAALIGPPSIAATGAKGFVVGWTESGDCGDWWHPEKFPVVLHFSETGVPFAERYRLDDGSCLNDTGWDLAALSASPASSAAFFNAAESYRNSVQRFAPDGRPTGRRRVVGKRNPCDSRSCEAVANAAMSPDGRSAVMWDVDEYTGDPEAPTRHSLVAQFFDSKGHPAGDRFEIVTSALEPFVVMPTAAAFDKEGILTVAWTQEIKHGSVVKTRLSVRQFRFAAKPDGD